MINQRLKMQQTVKTHNERAQGFRMSFFIIDYLSSIKSCMSRMPALSLIPQVKEITAGTFYNFKIIPLAKTN